MTFPTACPVVGETRWAYIRPSTASTLDAISNNMTLIPNVKSPQFGNVGRVIYVQEQKIYWGVKPVTFTFIKEPTS